jgi:hypothetical protein
MSSIITTTTVSSVSTNIGPTTFSKAAGGVEGVPDQAFITIKNMQKAIDSYGKKLEASKVSPYLIFRHVTTNDVLEIERERERGE